MPTRKKKPKTATAVFGAVQAKAKNWRRFLLRRIKKARGLKMEEIPSSKSDLLLKRRADPPKKTIRGYENLGGPI
jgi:hypothetical protein